MCSIMCTMEEIACVFDVPTNVLRYWVVKTYGEEFSQVYSRFASVGKMSIRRSQMKLAEKNPYMAIWLGKQYLGQVDPDKEREKENKEVEDWTPIAEMLKDGNK